MMKLTSSCCNDPLEGLLRLDQCMNLIWYYHFFVFVLLLFIFLYVYLILFICFQLFFPILHEKHWFVFVVDINDRYFVFLDSLYSRNSEYRQDIEGRLCMYFLFFLLQFDCLLLYFLKFFLFLCQCR